MFNAPEVISGFRQVGDFQCDKVNVRFHRPGDLFGCIAIVIDVLKNLIGVEQDFCGNDVRLILRLRGHVIQHELLYRASFCQIAVQLIMPKLMSADNPLHLSAQVFVYENKTAALDDPIHSLERAEVLTEQDFNAKLPCYAKWISCPAALYKLSLIHI